MTTLTDIGADYLIGPKRSISRRAHFCRLRSASGAKKKAARGRLLIPRCATRSVTPAKLLYRRELSDRARELGLRRCDLELAGAVLHRFLGLALRFERFGFVEVVAADRGIGEHRDRLRLHFE